MPPASIASRVRSPVLHRGEELGARDVHVVQFPRGPGGGLVGVQHRSGVQQLPPGRSPRPPRGARPPRAARPPASVARAAPGLPASEPEVLRARRRLEGSPWRASWRGRRARRTKDRWEVGVIGVTRDPRPASTAARRAAVPFHPTRSHACPARTSHRRRRRISRGRREPELGASFPQRRARPALVGARAARPLSDLWSHRGARAARPGGAARPRPPAPPRFVVDVSRTPATRSFLPTSAGGGRLLGLSPVVGSVPRSTRKDLRGAPAKKLATPGLFGQRREDRRLGIDDDEGDAPRGDHLDMRAGSVVAPLVPTTTSAAAVSAARSAETYR